MVYTVCIQTDGKIILGGDFTAFNGTTSNYIVRLNSNGTIDTAFTTNTGSGPDAYVYTSAMQSDKKIIIGGGFASYNSVTREHLARIGGDVAL
jgi:hypothetical protein